MASTTSTDPSTATGSPPPSPGLSPGTNYFFGFLIAFIAFLFVFLSLGLLARRRRMRLMRDFLLYGPDDSGLPNISQTEPMMWQPSYTDAKGQLWSNIMVCSLVCEDAKHYICNEPQPLSTSLVQREAVDDKTPKEVPPPRLSRNLFFLFRKPRPPDGPRKILVTEGMNIAVMINMPQAPEVLEEDDRHEYQIGVLRVPWKDEIPQT
ncbi:hypothetical protein B0H19DRAFT_1092990 [Mycena capillaripes]|nr:hypothetical protein B0H19DRAFT_1092990 [Mycena capillaripes]